MKVRQVITGHDTNNKAIVLAERDVVAVEPALVPGLKNADLWSTEGARSVPHQGEFPGVASYFPDTHGSVFRMIEFPPMTENTDGFDLSEDALADTNEKMPNALEHFELDAPGMHTTDSIDYGIVMKGEIHLELDDGKEYLLKTGDCVIQNGTRHAWRNRSGQATLMAFILLGATRVATAS